MAAYDVVIRNGQVADGTGKKLFRDGGTANDRLDTQKIWYLLSFEMWRSRWMRTESRTEGAQHARAVSY